MAGLKLMTQGGYVPRVAAHLLQDNEAQRAINTKLYAGDLRGWFKPSALTPEFQTIDLGETIFKMKDPDEGNRWVVWDSVVSVARSPIIDESEPYSIYYTENNLLKKTNSSLAGIVNGTPPEEWLFGGVPAPTGALTATDTGGGSTSPEDRVYVYTYIQEFGSVEEESAPSPASNIETVHHGNPVDLTGFIDPSVLANQDITKIRIYRSISAAGVTPTFLLVDEINASVVSAPGYTYTDTKTAAQLGEQMPSLEWVVPGPVSGVCEHPGGFLCAFYKREVLFSEIGYPHAWPIAYRQTVTDDIVGIAIYGTSLVVLTKGYTVVFSGSDPAAMTPEKMTELEPCVSSRSIASDVNGVMYASPNGICIVGPSMVGLATSNIMLREEFSKFNPPTIVGAVFSGKYFGFYKQGTEYLPDGGFILDKTMQSSPFSTTSAIARCLFVDPETANLYFLHERTIYKWEGDALNNYPFEWLSKKFVFSDPINLGAVEIDAGFLDPEYVQQWNDYVYRIIEENQAVFATGVPLDGDLNNKKLNYFSLNGSILQDVPPLIDPRYVEMTLYVDGDKKHHASYVKNGVFRLPSGYKGQIFEIKLAGNTELRYIKVAETMKELKAL